jgi:hypothetical protein
MTQAANLGALGTGASASGVLAVANGGTGATALGPAFYASRVGVPQSPSSSTWTKIVFNSESFDTANCFTSSTFTPTVAGYYLVSGCITLGANSGTISNAIVSIYKNGASSQLARPSVGGSNFTTAAPTVTGIIYMNGSTDYLELYGYITGTSPYFDYGDNYTYFQASLIRSA